VQEGAPVDLTEAETLAELLGDTPLFVAKERVVKKANGHDKAAAGTFDRDALCQPDSKRLDIEAAFAAMPPNGAGANEYQPPIIRAALLEGWTLGTIRSEVAERTVVIARAAGLPWTIEAELIAVEKRIFSCLKRLHHEKYDPATGEVPDWLPEELREAWIKTVAEGHQPILHNNRYGICVSRVASHAGKKDSDANSQSTAEPPKVAATPRASRILKIDYATFELPEFAPFDPATLPPRDWLFGRHIQRGAVSGTVAHGGRGKTTLGMVEAISMATCRNLLGEEPRERLRVWFHNGEDDMKELQRRLAAVCQHFQIDQEELRGWLYLTNGETFPLRVASGHTDFKMNDQLVELIHRQISTKQIDVANFDPLVSLHGVPENDSGKMDQVLGIFRQIASVEECGIDLSAHVRKHPSGINGLDHTGEDLRGTSSQFDAMRAVRVLNIMTERDAEAAGIPTHERSAYVRVDKAKGNNAPPGKAVWRKFVNVSIANGDEVGVLTPWDYPGQSTATDELADRVYLDILDRITLAGRTANDRSGPNYAPNVFAKEPEALLAKVGKAALAAAQIRLFAAGRLKVEEQGSSGRRVRRIVRC
jgi:RecA-family ATPase